MMIGLSEKLEWMLQDYHEHLSEENAQIIMNLIRATGDSFSIHGRIISS